MHHQQGQPEARTARSEPVNATKWMNNFRAQTLCSPEKARGGTGLREGSEQRATVKGTEGSPWRPGREAGIRLKGQIQPAVFKI